MSQQQITTILFAKYNTTSKEMEYHFTNSIYYVNNTDVIIDKEYKVQIDINPLNQEEYIRLAINTLRDRQTAAWADAQATVSQLEEQIKELQLITYQPDVLKDGEFQVKDETFQYAGTSVGRQYGAPINVTEIPRDALDEIMIPCEEAVLVDVDGGEIVNLGTIQQTELDIAEGEWEAYPEDIEPEVDSEQDDEIIFGESGSGTVRSLSFSEADELIVVDSISSQAEELLKLSGTLKVIPLSNDKCVPVSEDVADSADDYKDA